MTLVAGRYLTLRERILPMMPAPQPMELGFSGAGASKGGAWFEKVQIKRNVWDARRSSQSRRKRLILQEAGTF